MLAPTQHTKFKHKETPYEFLTALKNKCSTLQAQSRVDPLQFSQTCFQMTHFDGNQDGPSLKDPLQVPDGPITRSKAKKIKEAMQGLVQSTWDEASKSSTFKVGLKDGEPILIHLIQAVKDMT